MQGFTVVSSRAVLGTSDLGRAKGFWRDVLGFEVVVERPDFALFRAGEVEVAVELGSPAGSVLLHVHALDVLHARCVAAGARIVDEPHQHDSGRRDLTVLDPDGNRVRLAEKPRQGGRIGWVDLTVADAEGARDFWRAVAGFEDVQALDLGGYEDFSLTSDGRPVVGVCHARGVNASMPPLWMVYFVVDDLQEALAEVASRGGGVIDQRTRMAVVRDPSGVVAALFQA